MFYVMTVYLWHYELNSKNKDHIFNNIVNLILEPTETDEKDNTKSPLRGLASKVEAGSELVTETTQEAHINDVAEMLVTVVDDRRARVNDGPGIELRRKKLPQSIETGRYYIY